MDKRPDFGSDLATLNNTVSAEVGDVLQVLRQKNNAGSVVTERTSAQRTQHTESSMPSTEPALSAETSSSRRTRPSNRSRLKPVVERDESKKNVTLRIHPEIDELLTEAAHWQKIKRRSPSTRQGIAQEALEDWFRKHGYVLGSLIEESD